MQVLVSVGTVNVNENVNPIFAGTKLLPGHAQYIIDVVPGEVPSLFVLLGMDDAGIELGKGHVGLGPWRETLLMSGRK